MEYKCKKCLECEDCRRENSPNATTFELLFHFINQIKKEKPMRKLATQYVRLTQEENGFFYGYCPFHDPESKKDERAFKINDKKDVWYCDYCVKGGDQVAFLCLKKDMSMQDALYWLYRVELTEPGEE